MLKVYGRANSINVRKVLWLCAEMDLAYEHEQWGSGFRPTNVPEFLALNPNAMVHGARGRVFNAELAECAEIFWGILRELSELRVATRLRVLCLLGGRRGS